MKDFKNILVAVELTQEVDERIINKAVGLTKNENESLHLVHVTEEAYTPSRFAKSLHEYEAGIRRKMSELGTKFNVRKMNQFVKTGNVEKEIFKLLKFIDADLLVLGNHGRHGIESLFRANHATSLLKDADCDVLAVKVA
ncbi:MAG: universal stress protein [Oligoflexales bacterium]